MVQPLPRRGALARLGERWRRAGSPMATPEQMEHYRELGAAPRTEPADVHRPVPAANVWPDDAVLVTYSELRRLVALHLDLARQGMPADRPWRWIAARADAVRDGEAPLLIAEVLE